MALIGYGNTTTGNARNGQQTGWPTCWRADGYEYQIVTQTDWKPVIWRRTLATGVWESYDLSSTVLGLVDVTDSHRCLSMSVDGKGRVHVMGNVHSQKLKYVRSAPGSITSWESREMPSWWGANAYATYMKMEVFRDGTLVLVGKAATTNNAWTGTTPHRIALMPPDGDDWVPCRGTDGIVMQVTPPEDQQLSVDDIPDWTYNLMIHVDRFDILHGLFVWRVDYSVGGTMSEPIYVRSHDHGVTWQNVLDEQLTVPFTYRETLDGVDGIGAARVTYGATGDSFPYITNGGFCVDGNKYPHFCGSGSGGVMYHSWWDGTTWVMEDLTPWGFDAGVSSPSLTYMNGDVWLWGRRKKFLCGSPLPDPSKVLYVGRAPSGTPDGVYEFESSCYYHPMPIHGGGNRATRLALPNGNLPRVFSVGAHQ